MKSKQWKTSIELLAGIPSKRTHDAIITSFWRFGVIMTLLSRRVPVGMPRQCSCPAPMDAAGIPTNITVWEVHVDWARRSSGQLGLWLDPCGTYLLHGTGIDNAGQNIETGSSSFPSYVTSSTPGSRSHRWPSKGTVCCCQVNGHMLPAPTPTTHAQQTK